MSSTTTLKWAPRKRDYVFERKQLIKSVAPTATHPLGVQTIKPPDVGKQSLPTVSNGIDPLSVLLVANTNTVIDPLSEALAALTSKEKDKTTKLAAGVDDSFEPWSSKKASILTRYTTSEKISITTAIVLNDDDKEKMTITSQMATADRIKMRLEQLDEFEGGQETQSLTQQEYITRINDFNKEMIQSWKVDQRVKALKIVIQSSKLLMDMNVMQFYPSKFVLVTDLLDTFGKLVYNRLLEKCAFPGGKAPERVAPDLIPEITKETCRNWFYKIAIIRELLPRIFVEAAILQCYNFLSKNHYQTALIQLIKMCRGIADPLVAAFTRCYICRVGMAIDPTFREHIDSAFTDSLHCFYQVETVSIKRIYTAQKLSTSQYLSLYSPAIDWMLQCLTHKMTIEKIENVVQLCRLQQNKLASGLLLNSILCTFEPNYVRSHAPQFIEMINECNDQMFSKSTLIRSLGLCLILAPSHDSADLKILNDVWKVVTKFKDPAEYMACAEVWIELTAKEYTVREVNTMLGDIVKHLLQDRAFEDYYQKLHSIMTKILSYITDFTLIFTMDKFLPFLDLFQRENVKVDVYKSVLQAFVKNPNETTNDPILISGVMFIAKCVHDTLGVMTNEDELREISGLISSFIRKIAYGQDFEQELKFYVEARGAFVHLDSVTITLIQKVNTLAAHTLRIMNGTHSRTTASFVRACMAFCYITIPALSNPLQKLQLYTLCAQTAYLNQSPSQGDAFLKTAITILSDFPKSIDLDNNRNKLVSSEKYLLEVVSHIMSTLIIVPDNPDSGVLYLFNGLQNVINQLRCLEDGSETKILLSMNLLCLLSTYYQVSLPYHIPKVESNDVLYGCDPNFLNEINQRLIRIIEQIIQQLKELGNSNTKRQSSLALELLNRLVAHADLTQNACTKFALNLWNLVQLNGQVDTLKFANRVRLHIETRAVHDASFKRLAELIALNNNNEERTSRSSTTNSLTE